MADIAKTLLEQLPAKTSLLNTDLVFISDPVGSTDNKITIANLTTTLISTDTNNALSTGGDARLKITPDDVKSTDADNLLSLGADNKLKADAVNFISSDANNTLQEGTDNKLFAAAAPLAITNNKYIRGTGTGYAELTVAQVKTDLGVTAVEGDVTTLQSDVSTLQSDVTTLEGQVVTGFMHVVDEKSSSSHGGSNATGTATRVLNTIKTNTISGASLSSNRVTLPAGTYIIDAKCMVFRTVRARALLYNYTTSSYIMSGLSIYPATSSASSVELPVKTIVTFSTTTQVELRNYNSNSNSGDGYGVSVGDGRSNIYAEMLITKIG